MSKNKKKEEPSSPDLTPRVFFEYDEQHAHLNVEYSEKSNEITLSGGRNGFARLAELLVAWTKPGLDSEDEHWFHLRSSDYALTLYLDELGRFK